MWNGSNDNKLYILDRDHHYENSVCSACGHTNGPVITKQPESVNAAIGEKFSLTVEAEGEDLLHQWYYSNDGGKSFAVSSFKSRTYSMTMAEWCHLRQVHCVITDQYGSQATTDVVELTAEK